jgi:NAD(P)-dependent dehydrogenase (short-subunit alcohol dehydrogenase family)
MKPWVFITGVSGGIGQALVAHFKSRGWQVAGTDKIAFQSENIDIFYHGDIADSRHIEEMAKDFSAKGYRLKALINNAAIQICKSAHETTLAEWQLVMAVNVQAPFWLTCQLYPSLKEAKGSIINLSSVHAIATSSEIAAYAASKGALTALTRAQAIDFAGDGVRVNAILPGAVDTRMLETGLSRGHLIGYDDVNVIGMKKQLARKTVIGKIGSPDDIANMAFFLADDQHAGFITGQTFVVDGGALARLSTEL